MFDRTNKIIATILAEIQISYENYAEIPRTYLVFKYSYSEQRVLNPLSFKV